MGVVLNRGYPVGMSNYLKTTIAVFTALCLFGGIVWGIASVKANRAAVEYQRAVDAAAVEAKKAAVAADHEKYLALKRYLDEESEEAGRAAAAVKAEIEELER